MHQKTFSEGGFEHYGKRTRREQFLDQVERVVSWSALCALIEPVYFKGDRAGRPPVGLEQMLWIHFLQHWLHLADPAVEEALYDSNAMGWFVGIDLGRELVPDETTVCKFRHLLEAHGLGEAIFEAVGRHLQAQVLKVGTGTIVDATIISAPTSTKNKVRRRDPEMRQTKKGNQWYFGMKGHLGEDSRSKLIHSVEVTAANVHDSQKLAALLHGGETRVWDDSAYVGQREAMLAKAPYAQSFVHEKGKRSCPLSDEQRSRNRSKSRVRAKGEHPIHVIKRIFGFTKVRYRGLMKNTHRLHITCALANLFMVRRQLLRLSPG